MIKFILNTQGLLHTYILHHILRKIKKGMTIKQLIFISYDFILRLLRELENGKEFAYHKEVSEALNTDFYFAHPYSSWERGLNKHTNGLIRQYLPKKTDFTQVSKEEIISIQNKLNHRFRKVLGYRTPYEVFFKEFVKVLAA